MEKQPFSAYLRTDMAAERYSAMEKEYAAQHRGMPDGIVFRSETQRNIQVERVEILNEESARLFEKPPGVYLTYYTDDPSMLDKEARANTVSLLADNLRSLAKTLAGAVDSVLVCGLGNRHMTADAVGTGVADRLTVTGHLTGEQLRMCTGADCTTALYAVAPGVVGQTGIETAQLVRGAVTASHPSLVVLIDALAARETERLCKTVQVSTTGIRPGGGVGNHREAIDAAALGVPVMTVGVPMVIDAGTLLYDALLNAPLGLAALQPDAQKELEQVFNRSASLFITPKDADRTVASFARLIANALMQAFLDESFIGLSEQC